MLMVKDHHSIKGRQTHAHDGRGNRRAQFQGAAILFGLILCLPAFAAESKHDKDIRECKKAPPVMQHPADLKKAKQEAFNKCMHGRGYAVGKIRGK